MTVDPSQPTTSPSPSRQPTGWRKWAFRLAAMTLVPAALLGVLELALRIGGYGYATHFFVSQPSLVGAEQRVANPKFGRRFFPPGLTRSPLPIRLAAAKPSNTQRVFVLGESAALGFPDPSSSFARIVEVMLQDQFPEKRIEVINTAMVAINSNAILPIARECASYEPDLFLVFMGNNEVVGPFGAAGVIGPFTPSLSMIRANLAVKTMRTGQLLHRVVQGLKPGGQPSQAWEGMAIFQHSRIRADAPPLDAINDHLRRNLADICRAGAQAGAQVIVGTVPVNLKDSPPFASLHRADLTEADLAKWETAYQAGATQEADGKWAEAIAHYATAEWIDAQFADLPYRQGRCLLALGKSAEARGKFEAARDLDALRFRADHRTNAAIRAVAEAEGATVLDAETLFAKRSAAGIPGDDFFHEHVHLNFTGSHLLALAFCEKILESPRWKKTSGAPLLSETECARRLAHTDWNRYQVAVHIQGLMQQPPFTGQLDHAKRDRRWQERVDGLRAKLTPEGLRQMRAEYADPVKSRPDDWMLTMNYAALLAAQGVLPEAMEQYGRVVEQEPQNFGARLQLGQIALSLGRTAEARFHFEAVLRWSPDDSEAHYGLADTWAAAGAIESAREIYAARVKCDPSPAQALEKMAGFLARHNKLDEAKRCLDEALTLQPDSASVHANLGDVLATQGSSAAARTHYEAALRLRPGWPAMVERLAKGAPK